MNLRRLLALAVGLFLLSEYAAAQVGSATGGIVGPIGASDSVSIEVFREPDLATVGQLNRRGEISMPLIGKLKLSGLTTLAAEKMIEAKLKDGYLVRPQVRVRVTKKTVRSVTVLGEVRQPGVFTIPNVKPLTLVQAIGMAGGVTDIANSKKVVVKNGVSGGAKNYNLRQMQRGEVPDLVLRDGDVVTVLEAWF